MSFLKSLLGMMMNGHGSYRGAGITEEDTGHTPEILRPVAHRPDQPVPTVVLRTRSGPVSAVSAELHWYLPSAPRARPNLASA